MPKGSGHAPASANPIVMTFYTITERPDDAPDEYILRRHFLVRGGQLYTEFPPFLRGKSLEEVRAALHRKVTGLTNMGRQPDDAPAIVETWF
jgi:hypothetical protein